MQKMKILNFVLIDSTYPIGTCRNAKNENFEFCFDCGKNVFQWTRKNHLGHFDWNCLGSRYPIRPNTQNMAILTENRRLRLKGMLRGPKLWVSLILNVIGVRLRFIGTHFDHNRYIIRILIFWFFCRSLWSHAKVADPLYRGFQNVFSHKLLFQFGVSNPFNVLEVGKTKFSNLSPLPTYATEC